MSVTRSHAHSSSTPAARTGALETDQCSRLEIKAAGKFHSDGLTRRHRRCVRPRTMPAARTVSKNSG